MIVIEPSDDTPLVWFEIAIRGGAGADPVGQEGLHRHAALLARRGAGTRERAELDDALDSLGASLDPSITRDAITLSGVTLSRHLDAVVELAADILAAPTFNADEHARLLRETPQVLDEYRDDDATLAQRWFEWVCCPGHPYGRTSIGTAPSIARLDRDSARALWQRELTRENLVIGIAGDVDETTAQRVAARLVERLPARGRAAVALDRSIEPPHMRRTFLVDKPHRTQAQIRIGHLSARYGDADTPALTIAETVFGGLFTSRLMQELRVKRGWTYGASCGLRRSRLPHWFEIWMAAGIDVAGDAVKLTLDLLADYAAHGPTDEEFAFARDYLVGSMPFSVATAQQRMQLAVGDAVFELPSGYTAQLPAHLQLLTAADVRAACARHLKPDAAVTVAVTTAEQAKGALVAASSGPVRVVAHDEY